MRPSGPMMRLVFEPGEFDLAPSNLSGCTSSLMPSTVDESHLAKSLNSTSSVVAKSLTARSPVNPTSGCWPRETRVLRVATEIERAAGDGELELFLRHTAEAGAGRDWTARFANPRRAAERGVAFTARRSRSAGIAAKTSRSTGALAGVRDALQIEAKLVKSKLAGLPASVLDFYRVVVEGDFVNLG